MKTKRLFMLLFACLCFVQLFAMNSITDEYKAKLQSKLSAYTALLDLRYKCMFVTTSQEALLQIGVMTENGDLPLESVAKAEIMDDENYIIEPFDQADMAAIRQAFLNTYPQLKQSIVQVKTDSMLPIDRLKLTVPEVDDYTQDDLNNTVRVRKEQCNTLFQKELTSTMSALSRALAKEPEELKKGLNELHNTHDDMWRQVEGLTSDIRSAIREANDRYHDRHKDNESGNVGTSIVSSMTLEDGLVKRVATNLYVRSLTFKRRFMQDGLYTFCLPFSFNADEMPGKFYDFDNYDADGRTVTFALHTGMIEAGKGYLFVPDEDIEQWVFTNVLVNPTMKYIEVPEQTGLYGSLSQLFFLEDAFLMQSDADGNSKLVKADAETTLAPYQSYLWLGVAPDADELTIRLTDVSTDISTHTTVQPYAAAMYNLRGQRITTPHRGEMYIQNGKKYIR